MVMVSELVSACVGVKTNTMLPGTVPATRLSGVAEVHPILVAIVKPVTLPVGVGSVVEDAINVTDAVGMSLAFAASPPMHVKVSA
jgi:hypothetical protein